MAQSFTTDVTQWQGVDDEPTAGSRNLVESGGVHAKTFPLENKFKDYAVVSTDNLTLLGNAYFLDNSNKQIKSQSGLTTSLYYFAVESGVTYKITSELNWYNTYDAVAFSADTPVLNGYYNISIIAADAPTSELFFEAPQNGYILLLQRVSQKAYIYTSDGDIILPDLKNSVVNLQTRVNDAEEDISELQDNFDDYQVVPLSGLTLIGDGYLQINNKLIHSGTNATLYYYQVEKGKHYYLTSGLNWYNIYDAIGFATSLPSIGGNYTSSVINAGEPTQNLLYTASQNGYLILTQRTYQKTSIYTSYGTISIYELKEDVKELQTETEEIQEEFLGYEVVSNENLTLLGNAILKHSNKLITSDTHATIYYFQVEKDKKYKLVSQLSWYDSYDAVAFSINTPSIGSVYDDSIIVANTPTTGLIYTPTSNGYILLTHRTAQKAYIYTKTKMLSLPSIDEDVTNLQSDVTELKKSPLYNKTIAIIGDSIMEFMGGSVPENTITLKNYSDPTDTTIYQESDATVIDGIIYLTSSLEGGEVTENSVRLDIVNSAQSYIDSRGWDYIKAKLGAKDIINCGQGGGKYTEMGIVTSYPSTTPTDPNYSEMLQSFPNQVRMLKRLINNNVYDEPDCIVIWMGVNGTNNRTLDTLAEAMSIPWDTLKDDILGYNYRSKFYGSLRYGIESLYREFPDALIIFVSPVMTNRGNLQINDDNPAYRGYDDLKTLSNNIKSIAERYSCMFFNALSQIGVANFAHHADTVSGNNQIATGTSLGNLIPRYLGDGIHPNEAGKKLWGNYLSRMLLSFYFDKK